MNHPMVSLDSVYSFLNAKRTLEELVWTYSCSPDSVILGGRYGSWGGRCLDEFEVIRNF